MRKAVRTQNTARTQNAVAQTLQVPAAMRSLASRSTTCHTCCRQAEVTWRRVLVRAPHQHQAPREMNEGPLLGSEIQKKLQESKEVTTGILKPQGLGAGSQRRPRALHL